MSDFRLQLEQEIRVEVIIFGFGKLIPGEAPDRAEIIPQGEHLDMDDVALTAMKAPGAPIATGRAIVGQAHIRHQLQIFRCLGAWDPPVPPPRDHPQWPFDRRHDQWVYIGRLDIPRKASAKASNSRAKSSPMFSGFSNTVRWLMSCRMSTS